jgi:beta-lactamase class A
MRAAIRPPTCEPIDRILNCSRRNFIAGGAGILVLCAAHAGERVRSSASPRFAQIEAQIGGRVGVCAIDTGSGARLSHRGDARFAMCSTFKWVLAAAVLAQHDRSGGILEQRLSFGAQDLLAHSPVTEQHLGEGALSIAALCRAVVETSDNTAANTLLKFIGGPASLTRYLRSIGDHTTRLDRTELSLNSNLPGDPRDTTTPDAMIGTMKTVLLGDALSPASREFLLTWLKNCQTGLQRLRAGLPPTWTAGDKTGTGERGATNDVAIIWPPERQPILIAAYLSDSQASVEALDAAHARIGADVAAAFS